MWPLVIIGALLLSGGGSRSSTTPTNPVPDKPPTPTGPSEGEVIKAVADGITSVVNWWKDISKR